MRHAIWQWNEWEHNPCKLHVHIADLTAAVVCLAQVLSAYIQMASKARLDVETAVGQLLDLANNDPNNVPVLMALAHGFLLLKQTAKARNQLKVSPGTASAILCVTTPCMSQRTVAQGAAEPAQNQQHATETAWHAPVSGLPGAKPLVHCDVCQPAACVEAAVRA
jgi:crotonobetainyl-CoA:carnitine CoA-transferase CaiB-like acyl-CoA transferase